MIAWESAGSAGFKGSRKSTPFAAQVTADACRPQGDGARPAEGRGLRQRPGLRPRDRDPLAPGRRPRDPRRQGRHAAGAQRRPPARSGGASSGQRSGPKCRICRREGMKLFLKGERCLTEKCAIERRSYPPGEHGRGRIKQSEYLLQLREKQKARRYYGLLEKQFRTYYEKAAKRLRRHGRGAAADARDAARQRRLPARLRRLARAGPPARPPRPLPRQRPPGQHPELPGAAGRRRHGRRRARRRSRSSATRPISSRRSLRGSRPTTTGSRARC